MCVPKTFFMKVVSYRSRRYIIIDAHNGKASRIYLYRRIPHGSAAVMGRAGIIMLFYASVLQNTSIEI